MARRKRHFLRGATYHVMLRGNNGQSIFSAETDRYKFCLLIQEGVERYEHCVLAFCFMTNHVHLAIRVKNVTLSKICQNLAFRYTLHYNKQHKTIGHLFQGRFKSILIDSNRYLKELIRYIHLNPVRANLVNDPLDYRWSSHQAYMMQQEFTWLVRDEGLRKFGDLRENAVEAFYHFVVAGIGRNDGIDFKKGSSEGILGDEMFIEQMREETESGEDNKMFTTDLNTLISFVTGWYGIEAAMLQTPGIGREMAHIRAMTALLAKECNGVNLRELDTCFGRADSSMSQAALRLENRMLNSDALRSEFDELQAQLFLLETEMDDSCSERIAEVIYQI
jgi:putative transposase